MITSNKNEKITELTYNLTSLINKIENNIEIIDNDNFNNLLIKSKDLISKNESSYLYIIFSKGIFDVVSSIEQLYTNVYYQDYILIDSLSCKSYFQNDFEQVFLEIKIRLKYFLENHDKSLKIDKFKNDILYQVSLNDIYYESHFEINKLFSEIEKESLAPYIYSFCNMFLKYRRKYLMWINFTIKKEGI